MKIPFIKAIVTPFGIIGNNIKNFLKFASLYALALTVFSYALGSTYACLFAQDITSDVLHCSKTGVGFLVYQLIKFFLFASFAKFWYDLAFNNTKTSIVPTKQTLKLFLSFLTFALVCALPFLSVYLLYKRVPNPNWHVELLYFSVVSIGIWLPFVLIRFLSSFGYLVSNQALPALKQVWQDGKESAFRCTAFLMVLCFLFIFLIINFNQSFYKITDNLTIINILFVDFIYNLTVLLILAIFINHCIILKEFIKGDNKQ